MFEYLSSKKRKKPRLELSTQEINDLMRTISEADKFTKVEREFNRLYDATAYRMWDLLSAKYIPPLTEEDIHDVFQEAWVKILNQRNKYNTKYNAFSWIYVIKRNMIIDRIRQVKRSLAKRVDDEERDIIEEIPESATNFFDDLTANETVKIIIDAISSIDDNRDRDIVERRLIHEQKLDYISKETGIPLATVFKIIKRRIAEIKPKIEYLLNN
jgi:RNA polymerase sigma factor (sigma-70 family)